MCRCWQSLLRQRGAEHGDQSEAEDVQGAVILKKHAETKDFPTQTGKLSDKRVGWLWVCVPTSYIKIISDLQGSNSSHERHKNGWGHPQKNVRGKESWLIGPSFLAFLHLLSGQMNWKTMLNAMLFQSRQPPRSLSILMTRELREPIMFQIAPKETLISPQRQFMNSAGDWYHRSFHVRRIEISLHTLRNWDVWWTWKHL